MAVTILGIIQHRRGIKADLPIKLEEGELGFCVDTRELFIGNTPAQGGNTQIFTNATDVVQLVQYQFLSDTQVTSQTGLSMNQPIMRSLQAQLDDAWVNVKAYGAQGDGITDDTAAINRAIQDLYTKQLPTSENVRQARKTVWFPAGRYLVSDPILLYPEVHLQGENYQNTQLFQDNHTPSKLCVLRLTDSLGQTGTNLGLNSAQMPENQTVCDINLHTQNATHIVLLERPNQIEFINCWFSSSWTGPTVTPGTEVTGVTIESLGSFVYGDVWIQNCKFTNMEWAVYCDESIQNIHILNTSFKDLYLGVITSGSPGPLHVKVQNCVFDQIEQQAVKVMSTTHVSSLHNTYLEVNGGAESIHWAATTSLCSSMSDQFTHVPGVEDLGVSNLILNTQQINTSNLLTAASTVVPGTYYMMVSSVSSGVTSVLTSNLFTLDPDPAAPTMQLQAEIQHAGHVQSYRTDLSATVTLLQSDDVVGVDAGAVVQLPAAPTIGKTYTIKHVQGTASTSPVLIEPAGSAQIDMLGASTDLIMNVDSGSVTVLYAAVDQWLVI